MKTIPARLEALAQDMMEIATLLDYYCGFNPYALEKSREILGGSMIAKQWAIEIRDEMDGEE
jgi:hypothetical protein